MHFFRSAFSMETAVLAFTHIPKLLNDIKNPSGNPGSAPVCVHACVLCACVHACVPACVYMPRYTYYGVQQYMYLTGGVWGHAP